MNSLLTNASAVSALATLRTINGALGKTQEEVSSGYRIGTAADNAAYWSIATTMRSDRKSLGAVSDAISLGSATVDVAYSAMSASLDVLDTIKTKLVAAKEPGVDRGKIQKEIDQLQNQLQSIVDSASFNGENWLTASSADLATHATTVVSGFTRHADGTVDLQSIEVDLSKTVLLNGLGGGLLQTVATTGEGPFSEAGGFTSLLNSLAGTPLTSGGSRYVEFTQAFTVDDGDSISFTLQPNTGGGSLRSDVTVTIDRDTVDQALGPAANGAVSGMSQLISLVQTAFGNAGLSTSDVTIFAGTGVYRDNIGLQFPNNQFNAVKNVSVDDFSVTADNPTIGIMDMDVSSSGADVDSYIAQVEKMLHSVTNAAADLGSIQSRLSLQTTFTADLMDSLTTGIGTLVDANMNESSTRLKALQTQQQLGMQALSIANSSSDNLLQLFR